MKGSAPHLCGFLLVSSFFLLAAQNSDLGRTIYSECAKSVFVLYARDPSGEFIAQGSGFWISGQKIVTNAHVANAGKIYVDFGSARALAKLESIDAFNDVAILTVEVDITAKPLPFADSMPSPGDRIFAIGNPEGLDRSISEGVVSATREIDRRELLQITAAISHGSSGGPIVNAKGQVVGVAVGYLASGQSLNFAVPATKVVALLKSGSSKVEVSLFEQIDILQEQHKQEIYSAEPDSPWQTTDTKIKTLLEKALETAGNDPSVLLRVATIANNSWDSDIAISSAQRLIVIKPSSQAHLIFARALTSKYVSIQDDSEKQRLMAQAEKEARLAVKLAQPPLAETFSVLANVLEDRGSYKDAQTTFQLALNAALKAGDSDSELSNTRGLIRCADALGEFDEAGRLLEVLRNGGNSTAWDWSFHAMRLDGNAMFRQAGDAYRTAAELSGLYGNWCSAATEYTMASGQEDSVLFCARKCIELGTGQNGSELNLASAHREIADVLNDRGVYTEGLNHAKEATVLKSDDPFAYDSMATALIGLRRFEEAVTAEQQALRLSDGKYAWMHFNLGSAYFSLENWNFALQSYEKAAELNPKEPAAAYNVALCHQRLRHWMDAVKWYEEYLKRKPDAPDKAKVLETIRILSQ